jgi:hypothetical protein
MRQLATKKNQKIQRKIQKNNEQIQRKLKKERERKKKPPVHQVSVV